MQSLKEKLTCGFKYDMRNLVNFHPTTQKSEYFPLTGSFCSKYIRFEKKYRGVIYLSWHWTVMQNLNKPWPCGMRNWWLRALKTLKKGFCPKHIMFQHIISWHWRVIKRYLFNFHVRSSKSQNFYFEGLLLSKANKVLDEKAQKSYVS